MQRKVNYLKSTEIAVDLKNKNYGRQNSNSKS